MSLNAILEQKSISPLTILSSIAELYKSSWNQAITYEERAGLEIETIDNFNRIINESAELDLVTSYEHLDDVDLNNFYNMIDQYIEVNNKLSTKLAEVYLSRYNSVQILFSDLLGKIKRIKQKQAVLALATSNKYKFLVAEKFLNMESLASQYISVEQCNVENQQGVLLLPIEGKEKVIPVSVRISSGSNGQPGNSDVSVNVNNQDLKIILQKTDQYFEYERLDQGPCKLVLQFEFNGPQIINNLIILPANTGIPVSFRIADIHYTSSVNQSISINELITNSNDDLFVIPVASYTDGWSLSHLPVVASSVSITFVQTQSHQIQTSNSNRDVSNRTRFAIPLQYIEFNRVQYKATGGINSLPITLPQNVYAYEPGVVYGPSNTSLYDLVIETSFDDGTTWHTVATDDDVTLNLINDNNGTFLWRLQVTRLDDSFDNLSSFYKAGDEFKTINTLLKTVSRYNSPNNITLPTTPKDDNVFALQTRLGRRGKNAYQVGTVKTMGQVKIPLPFNIRQVKVPRTNAHLLIGGVEYLQKNPGEILSGSEWSFSDDYNYVLINDNLNIGTPVEFRIDPEIMLLEEREDGFYHSTSFDFDPDKSKIQIKYLAKEPSSYSKVMPNGETIIDLGVENILDGSLVFTSNTGNSLEEVDTREEVYDEADNEYYVDYENGILYLASPFTSGITRVSLRYQANYNVDTFDIWYLDNIPYGIKIPKDKVEILAVMEVVGDSLQSVIDINTGSYGPRDTLVNSSKAKQLSHKGIIKDTVQVTADLLVNTLSPEEVNYVDGITEFLGLKEITNESTNETQAGSSGIVEFALSARSLWYSDLDVVFSNASVFNIKVNSTSLVNSIGKYHISSDGIVSVYVGANQILSGNIKLSYYYKDELFNPANKYSIDYNNGILYSYAELNEDAIISYKTASYSIEYDIAERILDTKYNPSTNVISINTQNLHHLNNLVKIIWTEEKVENNQNLKSYFSPAIDLVAFRFI